MLERIVCRDRLEWLTTRQRLGLGGSDAAAVVGASDYATPAQVFFKKRLAVIDRLTSDDAASIGQLVEEPLARRYAERTGREVVNLGAFTILRDDARPWMFATLDRVVIDRGILEVKSANFMGWQIKHDWLSGPPLMYQVQAQHQMAVTGEAVVDIAALVGVFGFFIFEIARDDAFIAQLVEAERRFWDEHILAGVTPVLDGEEETRRLVNAAWMPAPAKTIVLTDPSIVGWDAERVRAVEMAKAAAQLKNQAESHIIAAMEDAQIATLPDGTTYKRSVISKVGYEVKPTTYVELRRSEPKKKGVR